jgi:hypothetical protein
MGLEEDLKKAQDVAGQGNQELAALRQRIVNGESLGDHIKDYIFVSYGVTEFPAAEEKLRKFSETVEAHNGQQVMLLYTKSELIERGGCFSSDRYENTLVGQQLGLLDGEIKFDLVKGGILLPTNKYVQKGEDPFFFDFGTEAWKLKEGNIVVPGYHFRVALALEESRLPGPEMFFGDEVEFYFSSNHWEFDAYKNSKDRSEDKKGMLERSFHFARDSAVNLQYIAALNLLDVEVPPRFQERYNTQIRKKKEAVLEGIRGQENIEYYLHQALKLGLHKESREIQLEPGIKMNIPEYILAKCKEYKVKIPE